MPIQDTSIDAYHELIRSQKLSADCAAILRCLLEHGPQADFELAARLNKHPSQISARRGDLTNEDNTGKVVFTGSYKHNPHTNKTVRIWRANVGTQPSLFGG